jgi:hypothetical protein
MELENEHMGSKERGFLKSVGTIACLAGAMMIGACGDDGGGSGGTLSASTVQQFCNSQCTKLDECGVSFFPSVEACVANCVQNSNEQPVDCNVTNAQAESCISAIDASACEDLGATFEASCSFCPEEPEAVDAGGFDSSSGDGSGETGPCAELEPCCADVDSEEARATCQSTVASGSVPLCTQTLQAYRGANLCQ